MSSGLIFKLSYRVAMHLDIIINLELELGFFFGELRYS